MLFLYRKGKTILKLQFEDFKRAKKFRSIYFLMYLREICTGPGLARGGKNEIKISNELADERQFFYRAGPKKKINSPARLFFFFVPDPGR